MANPSSDRARDVAFQRAIEVVRYDGHRPGATHEATKVAVKLFATTMFIGSGVLLMVEGLRLV